MVATFSSILLFESNNTEIVGKLVPSNKDMSSNVTSPVNPLSKEPLIDQRFGHLFLIQNESQASQLADFNVKFPTKLPQEYNLQLSVVDPTIENNKYVWLFYSKTPISDNMTTHDFWEHGGISIDYYKVDKDNTEEIFTTKVLPTYIDAVKNSGYLDAHQTTINGHAALAYSQVYTEFQGWKVHQPSQVEFIEGNSHITLQADLPLEELIQVAKSIG